MYKRFSVNIRIHFPLRCDLKNVNKSDANVKITTQLLIRLIRHNLYITHRAGELYSGSRHRKI